MTTKPLRLIRLQALAEELPPVAGACDSQVPHGARGASTHAGVVVAVQERQMSSGSRRNIPGVWGPRAQGPKRNACYRLAHDCHYLSCCTSHVCAPLRPGDLLLADRHFAGAHYYVRYQRQGLDFLTRAHQCLKISRIKRGLQYTSADFIGKLTINEKYRRADPSLPTSLPVRFVRASLSIR